MLDPETRQSVEADVSQTVRQTGRDLWWLLLIAGLVWFLVALVVLRFTTSSIVTVGVLIGIVFLGSAALELAVATFVTRWAWARALLAALFVGGAIWSFVRPYDAFWSLATAFGFLLVFKGTLDLVEAVTNQSAGGIWWLGFVSGILEIGLGFWASQQYFPARAVLLVLWVGFYALFRGFSEIALAFKLRAIA